MDDRPFDDPGSAVNEPQTNGSATAEVPARQEANRSKFRESIRAKMAEGAAAFFQDVGLLKQIASQQQRSPSEGAIIFALAKKAHIPSRQLSAAIKEFAPKRTTKTSSKYQHVHGFAIVNNCLCQIKSEHDAETAVELANFAAEIVDETIRDDGTESKIYLGISGRLQGGRRLPRMEITGADFSDCKWIVSKWGSAAIVWPGFWSKLPAAIQAVSKNTVRRTVYTHTGWREIVPGRWAYLHAGGALGLVDGDDPISVDLRHPVSHYVLPDPKSVDLPASIEAELKFLAMAPKLAFPLLAGAFRATIGGADFSLFITGKTGLFKSEIAALSLQHFGAGLNARNLPGNWSSTGNALEMATFYAKDALFVVDDYVPNGGANAVSKLNQAADRLLRGQGNNSGRQRLDADSNLQVVKPPRGLIISTGEDVPRGESLRARMVILEIAKGDIPKDLLSKCQIDAAQGLYAGTMSAFITWLAPRYAALKRGWAAELNEIRERATDGNAHARGPSAVAELFFAFRCFLKFAGEMGQIDDGRRVQLEAECWRVLCAAAIEQTAHLEANNPAPQFLSLIVSALAAGSAHLAGIDGQEPLAPAQWGWRMKRATHATGRDEWIPQGVRIGWIDDLFVYLQPRPSYAVAENLAKQQGDSLSVTPAILNKRLKEAGYIERTDETRETITRRKRIGGMYQEVLWMSPRRLGADEKAVALDDGPRQ